MKAKSTGFAAVVAVFGVLTVSLLGASPAFAGVGHAACASNQNVSGTSDSSGAASSKPSATICGNVGVRALYQLYPGSPSYWAAWSYGTYDAVSKPGNTILGGQHTATKPASGYASNFPFYE